MNGIASEGVRAVCPECSSVKSLGRSELGQEIVCWDCGTSFVVVRHRRRRRSSHQLRTATLLDQWDRVVAPPATAVRGVMLVILSLLLLTLVVALVAWNWASVAGALSRLAGSIDWSV